jgi:hypothetical protein
LKKNLNVAYNYLSDVPQVALELSLDTFDISFNLVEHLPHRLRYINNINVVGNPLNNIIPAYRNDNNKVVISSSLPLPWFADVLQID